MLRAKDERILTETERALQDRIALEEHESTKQRATWEFDLKKQRAEAEQEVKNTSKRASMQLGAQEADLRTDYIERIAKINKENGIAALPVDVQRDIHLMERQAVLAAASGNTKLAEEMINVVVKAAGADRDKSYLDLLSKQLSFPNPAQTYLPEFSYGVQPEPESDKEDVGENPDTPDRLGDANGDTQDSAASEEAAARPEGDSSPGEPAGEGSSSLQDR